MLICKDINMYKQNNFEDDLTKGESDKRIHSDWEMDVIAKRAIRGVSVRLLESIPFPAATPALRLYRHRYLKGIPLQPRQSNSLGNAD